MPSLASRLGSPRRWATLAAAVLLLASAGCGGSDDETAKSSAAPVQDAADLEGSTYASTSRLPVGGIPQTPIIRAAENGFSRVNTGCNTGRTRIRVVGDEFVFGPTTTTRQRCRQPASEIERRILAVLDGRTHYVFSDGSVLVVEQGDDGLVMQVR